MLALGGGVLVEWGYWGGGGGGSRVGGSGEEMVK